MSEVTLGGVLTPEQIKQFREEGYLLVQGLFADDAAKLRDHFMQLHSKGAVPGHFEPKSAEEANGDILKQYPRMMHPHRFDELSQSYMLHPKVMNALADLLDEEPVAAQSMFYFKPPGAKGQALHQDNFYLKVDPGTCVAAWTAVDDADMENGGMLVVPQSNTFDIECPHEANPELSFTTDEVTVPEGYRPVPMEMKAGDVLFFNGSVIHGSYPNNSKDRFRRAFICHYAGISADKISRWYFPLYRHDGSEHGIEASTDGGPCGNEYEVKGPH